MRKKLCIGVAYNDTTTLHIEELGIEIDIVLKKAGSAKRLWIYAPSDVKITRQGLKPIKEKKA